ncbi:hypothetical protein D9757_008394 [Collybiopsis confluens]|uniref:Uncharacterized protein n=1 Tax=Collybiopsis confluens TaxID=2823264 RepID=A0A8H5HHK0_9AGAR|nr:hypothetical protein D9757_008394 [Collybiopsis confluens]
MSVGVRTARSKTPSSFSTSVSQLSDEGKGESNYDQYPPTRSSTGTVGGILVDLSDQVLRTVVGVAQFTPTPYLGSLAVVALSIFSAIQGARDNQDSLKQLAHIAITSVDTVNSTYKELQQQTPTASSSTAEPGTDSFSSDPTLNRHVAELLRILQKIDDWVKSLTSRNILRRVVASRSDLNFIQDFKDQIKQALDKFQLQSMITLRYSVSRMAAQQQAMEQEAVREFHFSCLRFPLRHNSPLTISAYRLYYHFPTLYLVLFAVIQFSLEHRHKSTQETLLTIHEEMKNQNLRRSTTPQVHFTDRPFSSEPSSESPPLSPSLTGPSSRSPASMNSFWSQNSKNPFYQATRNATAISGNITVQNISGDHNVNTKTDNSRRENFGNVSYHTHNNSHSGSPRNLSGFGFDGEDEGYRNLAGDERRRRRVGTPSRGSTSDEDPDEDEWYERFGNERGYGYTPDGNHASVLPNNHALARGSGGRGGTGRSNVPGMSKFLPPAFCDRTEDEVGLCLKEDTIGIMDVVTAPMILTLTMTDGDV